MSIDSLKYIYIKKKKSYWITLTNAIRNKILLLVQMLLEQSRTFYFLWWNKSNIKEIKTTLRFACQINISLKITNKTNFLGVPQNFSHWMGDTKKIKLKLLVSFPHENEKQVLHYKENACHSLTLCLLDPQTLVKQS